MFWAVSTLIFVLTATLSFMLFRDGIKLYIDRHSNREGSRIRTKLVLGGLALSLLPVVFLVAFGYVILNRTIAKWFSAPGEGMRTTLVDTSIALDSEVQSRADVLAKYIAMLPDVRSGTADFGYLCRTYRISSLRLGAGTVCSAPDQERDSKMLEAQAPLEDGRMLMLGVRRPINLAAQQEEIERYMGEYNQLAANQKNIRSLYLRFLLLIALFILFVATWIALRLSRVIYIPISALLVAAGEVRKGNLGNIACKPKPPMNWRRWCAPSMK